MAFTIRHTSFTIHETSQASSAAKNFVLPEERRTLFYPKNFVLPSKQCCEELYKEKNFVLRREELRFT
jgi:hypothetical protein